MKSFLEWLGKSVGSKPSWMGHVVATGTTPHGTWYLEKNSKRQRTIGFNNIETKYSSDEIGDIITLLDEDGIVKAYMYVDLDEESNLYVNYAQVIQDYRNKGLYKELLSSLRKQFTVHSDQPEFVNNFARKAYERLGARANRYGHHVLDINRESEP